MTTTTNKTTKKSTKETILAVSHFGHPNECTSTTPLHTFTSKSDYNAWRKEQLTDGAEYYSDFDMADYVTIESVTTKLKTGYAVIYVEEDRHDCEELSIDVFATFAEALADMLPRICNLDSNYYSNDKLNVLYDKYVVPFDLEDTNNIIKDCFVTVIRAGVPTMDKASEEVKNAYETLGKHYEMSADSIIEKFNNMSEECFHNASDEKDIVGDQFIYEGDYDYCCIGIEKF